MKNELTTEEYRNAIKKLVSLMKLPTVSKTVKQELEVLLDSLEQYNQLADLKIK